MAPEDDRWSRVVDDQHFTFVGLSDTPSSCRLQVLRSDRGEVLLVAVQQMGQDGTSLVNGAEMVVEAAWRRYAPELDTPPPMHARLLGGSIGKVSEDITVVERDDGGWFRASWRPPQPDEWAAIEAHAELDRGSTWSAAPERVPTDWFVWRDFPVAALPGSTIWKPSWVDPPPPVRPKRFFFSKVPTEPQGDRPGVHTCCRYHSGSWADASSLARDALVAAAAEAAARAVEADRRAAVAWLDLRDDDDRWLHFAAVSLIDVPIVLAGRSEFSNGAHRSQAMRDQGVETTVVQEMWPIGSPRQPSWLLCVPHR